MKGCRECVDECFEHGDFSRKLVRGINDGLKITIVGAVLEPSQVFVGERNAWFLRAG